MICTMCAIDTSIQRRASFLACFHAGTVLLLGFIVGAVNVLWGTLNYVKPTPQEKLLSMVMQVFLWCLRISSDPLKGVWI